MVGVPSGRAGIKLRLPLLLRRKAAAAGSLAIVDAGRPCRSTVACNTPLHALLCCCESHAAAASKQCTQSTCPAGGRRVFGDVGGAPKAGRLESAPLGSCCAGRARLAVAPRDPPRLGLQQGRQHQLRFHVLILRRQEPVSASSHPSRQGTAHAYWTSGHSAQIPDAKLITVQMKGGLGR